MSDDVADCPLCGCNDVRVLRTRETAGTLYVKGVGKPVVRRSRVQSCGHCGHGWTNTTQEDAAPAGRRKDAAHGPRRDQ